MKKLLLIFKEIIKTEITLILEFFMMPIYTLLAFVKYPERFENKNHIKNFVLMNFFDWVICPIGIVVMPYRIVKRNLK